MQEPIKNERIALPSCRHFRRILQSTIVYEVQPNFDEYVELQKTVVTMCARVEEVTLVLIGQSVGDVSLL
jgi:hypothetical protein